jgi:dTMP kinase
MGKTGRGLFITLEGGEGGGKSTQSRLLAERLKAQGHDVIATREPGGTPEAEKIRNLLVQREGGDWSPLAEMLLMFAARAMHVRDLIAPALSAGKTVICDRFTDSTRAYQGHAGGVSMDLINAVHAQHAIAPDLTLILDIPAEAGLKRSARRLAHAHSGEDRFEAKDLAFHEKLRQGYLAIARAEPARCRVIDATQPIDAVAEEIWKTVHGTL